MLQTKFMDDYIVYGPNIDVFMSALLLALTCGFNYTSEIVDFKACLYASTFLNHFYVEYYQ